RRRRERADDVVPVEVEYLLEDRLHGHVPDLAEGEGAPAGGFEPLLAVALGEPNDALSAADPIDGTLAEERLDELGRKGPDLLGRVPHRLRSGKKAEELFWREVVVERLPLAAANGAGMRRDALVVGVHLDARPGRAEPEELSHEAVRRAVER